MTQFSDFKAAVSKQLKQMEKGTLYLAKVDPESLWNLYLDSFPEGTNPIYRERREYDCSACKSFFRHYGNLVTIKSGKIITVWDIDVPYPYNEVAKALAKEVKQSNIDTLFFQGSATFGCDKNKEMQGDTVVTWEHFFYKPHRKFVVTDPEARMGEARSTTGVFQRGLDEISEEALLTVIELIKDKNLYRGEEWLDRLEAFHLVQSNYKKQKTVLLKHLFCWEFVTDRKYPVKLRNSSMGTLLLDLSNGVDLEKAITAYETKVAPTNYRRPTKVVTKRMIQDAQKAVEELGIESALLRRFASLDDINVSDVLFADKAIYEEGGLFEQLIDEVVTYQPQNFYSARVTPIEEFIDKVVPDATAIELLMENRFEKNLVSIIAPENEEAPSLFSWDNNFSWAYNGDLADSLREKVRSKGGNVEGELRCSVGWFNFDDLDLHVIEPGGSEIYFGRKQSKVSGGFLDVDMNAGGRESRESVENIAWGTTSRMKEGEYTVFVHNYSKRETVNVGFVAEIEYKGNIKVYHYKKAVPDNGKVVVATFTYSHKDGIKFTQELPYTEVSRDIWGIKTNAFHRVNTIMFSPNHWGNNKVGSKHYFFLIEKCLNPGKARGIFNEFLLPELNKHRKVFEVLGSKIKTPESTEQLSGVGFHSTVGAFFICKVIDEKGNGLIHKVII